MVERNHLNSPFIHALCVFEWKRLTSHFPLIEKGCEWLRDRQNSDWMWMWRDRQRWLFSALFLRWVWQSIMKLGRDLAIDTIDWINWSQALSLFPVWSDYEPLFDHFWCFILFRNRVIGDGEAKYENENEEERWRAIHWNRVCIPVLCVCVCETRDACTSLKVKSESERREVAIFGGCIFTKRWIHRKLRTRVARSGPCVASRCPGFYSVFRNMSRMLRSNEEAKRIQGEAGEGKWDWKSGEDGTRWDEKLAEQKRVIRRKEEDAPEDPSSRGSWASQNQFISFVVAKKAAETTRATAVA